MTLPSDMCMLTPRRRPMGLPPCTISVKHAMDRAVYQFGLTRWHIGVSEVACPDAVLPAGAAVYLKGCARPREAVHRTVADDVQQVGILAGKPGWHGGGAAESALSSTL